MNDMTFLTQLNPKVNVGRPPTCPDAQLTQVSYGIVERQGYNTQV
jgi:hypothetical protein